MGLRKSIIDEVELGKKFIH